MNGLIALSVQSSVERALENGSPSGRLSELTVMAVNLHNVYQEENILLDAGMLKSDTSRSKTQKPITGTVEAISQENNAQEELPVQTVIAISRNVDGIIALSLEKMVKQLCSVESSRTDPQIDESFEELAPLPDPTHADDTHAELTFPSNFDQDLDAVVSDDVSVAVRRNISAVVAVTLESVLQHLQNADDQLEQSAKEQASARSAATQEPQLPVAEGSLVSPREGDTGRAEQAPPQNLWDEDDNSAGLQDLPVAMSISIQRSVNAILVQALQNVIMDLTRESVVEESKEHYDEEEEFRPRLSLSDETDDARDAEAVPYDHAAVMTAIDTFDPLRLPDDDDNQASDRDTKGSRFKWRLLCVGLSVV